jgi:curli biogenesis system outer membrane secretion channel CsgG
MIWVLFLTFLLSPQASTAQAPADSPSKPASTALPTTSDDPSREIEKKLLQVKRIYVESFGDDAISKQVQSMIVSTLTDSKRFVVTENKDKADAILKGTGLEKTSQELHSNSEATAAGAHGGTVSGSWGSGSGSVSGASVGHSAAIEDSSTSTETVNDARVAVRLVDKDGDVIWATTQESKGAKYKGACADVADKVVKQLLHDLEKLRKQSDAGGAPGPGASQK